MVLFSPAGGYISALQGWSCSALQGGLIQPYRGVNFSPTRGLIQPYMGVLFSPIWGGLIQPYRGVLFSPIGWGLIGTVGPFPDL